MAVVCAAAFVAAAFAVGSYFNRPGSGVNLHADAAPLFARWQPHVGVWGTISAVLVAFLVVAFGPLIVQRTSWPALLSIGYLGTVAWTLSLALIDGTEDGLGGRLDTPFDYLAEVPHITSVSTMLSEFSERIPTDHPDNWATHVAGHPPGATLIFVWLGRLGLTSSTTVALAVIAVGALVTVAVPVTMRSLGDQRAARAVVPFLMLFPGAIWMGTSADGLFAGVTAVGIMMLALAVKARRYRRLGWSIGAGIVLGFAIFLSYGFVLLGVLALSIIAYKRAWRVLPAVAMGALAVVAAFAYYGFWWFEGYELVVERYYDDVVSDRPYSYWVWANLAALALVVGGATIAGVRRVIGERNLNAVAIVVAGSLLIIAAADLSGLSKAEVERIWLPFAVWLLPAATLLSQRSVRWWLAGQAALALTLNHLLWTWW